MFMLQAPYPGLHTTIILPNPTLGDTEAINTELTKKVAMDGTKWFYIKPKDGRRSLSWEFRLSRPKAEEVKQFLWLFHTAPLKVTDHEGNVWVGVIPSDRLEFDTTNRAAPSRYGLPGEQTYITIPFEGIKQ